MFKNNHTHDQHSRKGGQTLTHTFLHTLYIPSKMHF